METPSYIHIILIVFASFFGLFLRLPFAIWNKGIAGDALGVESKIFGLSKSASIKYTIHDAVNGDGYFPRPALFHYIVSRFPKKYWRIFSVLLNISFDIVTGWIVLFISYKMLSNSTYVSDPWSFAILGLFIFYSVPLLLPVTARLKATNNRSLGLFLCTCYFVCFYYSQFDLSWAYVGLALFAYLAILGSTFAIQVVLFFTPILSAFLGHYLPIAIILGLILLFWFLPFTGVKSILTFKWHHIKFYNKNMSKSFSTKSRKFIVNSFLFLFAPNGFTKKQKLFLYDAPLLILLYSVPFLLMFIKWFFNDVSWAVGQFKNIGNGTLESFCIAIGLTSTILFIVTSIGKARIFGESERYFEFSLPFLTALFIAFLEFNVPLDFVLVSCLIFVQIGITVFIHFISLDRAIPSLLFFDQSEEVDDIISWLDKNEPTANIATIPIRFGRALSSQQLHTKNVRCKFYYQMITPKNKLNEGLKGYLSEVHNKSTFKISPEELNKRYGINIMVVNTAFIEKRNPSYMGLLAKYEEIRAAEGFSIYRIRS